MKIKNLQNDKYVLVQQDQEVAEMNEDFKTDYDGFLVWAEDGAYREVYGFYGAVPVLSKNAYVVEVGA